MSRAKGKRVRRTVRWPAALARAISEEAAARRRPENEFVVDVVTRWFEEHVTMNWAAYYAEETK